MSGITLRAVPDPAPAGKSDAVFLILQRINGHWSPSAKVVQIAYSEPDAETQARQLKKMYPHQAFGVFMLRSEAREVANPIEIVRMPEPPETT